MAIGRRWVGVHLLNHGTVALRDILDLACRAEQLGFSGITLNEDAGHDAFALLGAAATRTSTLSLGTAIANVYFRTPLQLAMGAATVDDLSRGRAVLGVSVGHVPWNDKYHGTGLDKPIARLREYVTFIRKALTGDQFTHDGRLFQGISARLTFKPYRPDAPILVAGERRQMLQLAAELADGAIIGYVPPTYIANFAAEHLRSSARRAGRDPSSLIICPTITTCYSEDRATALANARAAFIQRIGQRDRALFSRPQQQHEELSHLVDLVQSGQQSRALEEVSELLVTDTIAAGNAAAIWKSVDRYFEAGATRVLLTCFPRTRDNIERTIRALAA
jgi:alkanesulfonate monooxygenase SsuD/methylene tetrahydromethanopterin reductase-like flavin-dependent oxidoreductase (luciferase family)